MTSSNIKGIDTLTDSLGATFNVADIGGGSGGAVDIKDSVLVATTVDGALATAFENGDTIDGVVLSTGDRILIKNQSAGLENGIYTVNASSNPTRATDADADAEVTQGLVVWVISGTANAKTGWIITTADPITVDTTAITFEQVAGGGGSDIEVQDEGTPLTTAVTKFNYAGAGVTVTEPIADEMLVTIPGGGGSGVIGINTGWVTVQTITPSTDASIDFTGLDATLYDEFELSLYNLKLSVDDTIGYRLETGGGGFDSGANYEWSLQGSGPTAFQTDGVGATEIQSGGGGGTGGANETQSGWLKLSGPNDAVWQTLAGFTLLEDVNNNINHVQVGGHWENTGVISGIQLITTGAATFDSGTAVLRGRLKTSASIAGFNPDWEVISAQEPSAAASVDFTFDPTLYDELQITGIDVIPSADGDELWLRVSEDSGSTFKFGATDYSWFDVRTTLITTPGTGTRVGDAEDVKIRLGDAKGTDTGESTALTIAISNPGGSQPKKTYFSGVGRLNDGQEWDVRGSGVYIGTTNAINGLRVLMSSGNISGKFVLRGRRKNPQTGSVDIDVTVQTTDDTETTLVSIPVASNQVIIAHGFGMGYDDSTGDTYTFGFTTTVQNEGGTTTAKGFTIDKLDPDVTGFDVTWDADDSGDVGRLRVTGAVATTVDWKVRYQITRIN